MARRQGRPDVELPKGKKLWWWAFNSTSKHVSTLRNPMFCGTSGPRTQFMIEAAGGVDVEAFSMVGDEEAEVLLFPGTKLEVVRRARESSPFRGRPVRASD